MEFYEITTGTSQKDIDDAINDIKKITTDLFTQSFMYSATETLLQIYYASHIIGANNIIKQITSKECDPYGLIDDSYTKAIKDNNWAVLYDKYPVLFEPKHRKICKPYLLTISDKFWFTGQGKFIATWLLHCEDCLCPGSIYNIKNHDLIALANKYLPYVITKEYIKEKYCNDDAIMTAPMKMIPFILNNKKYIFA